MTHPLHLALTLARSFLPPAVADALPAAVDTITTALHAGDYPAAAEAAIALAAPLGITREQIATLAAYVYHVASTDQVE